MEEEKITRVDVEEYTIAILVISEDKPDDIIHAVLYQSSPSEAQLISLKKEIIEDMGYDGPEDKMQYVEMPSEEFMEMIGAEEVDEES
jgi:hypothetical protein